MLKRVNDCKMARLVNFRVFLAKKTFLGFQKTVTFDKIGLKFYQIPPFSPFLTVSDHCKN